MERTELSLLELNSLVKETIQITFPEAYWVRAETSDVRVNASSGHCYLEFIEKNAVSGQLIARARGSIWSKTFRMLKPYFESETGQIFTSGLKVLVKVSVEFHELYGFSLTVHDIDPSYTLGDMVRRRMEIIRQLKEDGVYTLNKELPFPVLPQRIAVITSPTAAGYEDFSKQLMQNKQGYVFYLKLFPAVMQGEKTEESIIAALDRIYPHTDCFDAVVIIRGGGATSDLNSFDSYLLAANCAQFPVPIVTGIGHERDDTVIDLIAHTRAKTPTAVAEFLISCMKKQEDDILWLQQQCMASTQEIIQRQKTLFQQQALRLPALSSRLLERHRSFLQITGNKLPTLARNVLDKRSNELQTGISRLITATGLFSAKKQNEIQLGNQFIRMASPDYILKRGYTLTLKNGKILKKSTEVSTGDTVEIRFSDGNVQGQIL